MKKPSLSRSIPAAPIMNANQSTMNKTGARPVHSVQNQVQGKNMNNLAKAEPRLKTAMGLSPSDMIAKRNMAKTKMKKKMGY